MSVSALTYRPVATMRWGAMRAVLAIARANLRVVWRYWFFWIIIVISMMHFLVMFALIYIKSQFSTARDVAPLAQTILDQIQVTGTGAAYRDFLLRQSESVNIMLAYVAAVLLATDFQAGGVNFYLSKPISKVHYLLGKLGSLMMIVGLMTWAPAIILFIETALYSNSFEYVRDHTVILISITCYSLLLMIVPSLAAMAIAAIFHKAAAIIVVWIGLFVVMPAFAGLLRLVFGGREWLLLSLRFDFFVIAEALFGMYDTRRYHLLPYATGIVVAILVISVYVILRRLRPVEVVE